MAPTLSLLLVSTLAATSCAANVRRKLDKVPCDPDRCVLAQYSFDAAKTECGSCVGTDSKYRCPTKGNVKDAAMRATFGGSSSGFGPWSTSQCVHHKYEPGFLAFSGPSAFEDDFVPACPKAEFCACGATRDKLKRYLTGGGTGWNGFSRREKSSEYWASLAPGFTLAQGFSSVSGGSAEHFDLVFTHGDGRRQFCSTVTSFTVSPQLEHNPGPHTHAPDGYTTGCSWNIGDQCDGPGFKAASTSRSDCWWPRVKTVCVPDAADLVDVSGLPAEPTQAASTPPVWEPWGAWSSCSKKCGGGHSARHRVCRKGTGSFVDKFCPAELGGDHSEGRACNAGSCATRSTSCSYFPSCPSGFSSPSWAWCGWGRRRKQCVQAA